jgi:hypothetical protein
VSSSCIQLYDGYCVGAHVCIMQMLPRQHVFRLYH